MKIYYFLPILFLLACVSENDNCFPARYESGLSYEQVSSLYRIDENGYTKLPDDEYIDILNDYYNSEAGLEELDIQIENPIHIELEDETTIHYDAFYRGNMLTLTRQYSIDENNILKINNSEEEAPFIFKIAEDCSYMSTCLRHSIFKHYNATYDFTYLENSFVEYCGSYDHAQQIDTYRQEDAQFLEHIIVGDSVYLTNLTLRFDRVE